MIKELLFSLFSVGTPIDTYIVYDGEIIELPPNVCRAVPPIQYTNPGELTLSIPNGIVCVDKLFSNGFE